MVYHCSREDATETLSARFDRYRQVVRRRQSPEFVGGDPDAFARRSVGKLMLRLGPITSFFKPCLAFYYTLPRFWRAINECCLGSSPASLLKSQICDRINTQCRNYSKPRLLESVKPGAREARLYDPICIDFVAIL